MHCYVRKYSETRIYAITVKRACNIQARSAIKENWTQLQCCYMKIWSHWSETTCARKWNDVRKVTYANSDSLYVHKSRTSTWRDWAMVVGSRRSNGSSRLLCPSIWVMLDWNKLLHHLELQPEEAEPWFWFLGPSIHRSRSCLIELNYLIRYFCWHLLLFLFSNTDIYAQGHCV